MTVRSEFLRKCFFKRTLPLWKTLPRKKIKKKIKYETMKKTIKSFLFQRYETEIDLPQYGITLLECLPFYVVRPHNHPLLPLNLVLIHLCGTHCFLK